MEFATRVANLATDVAADASGSSSLATDVADDALGVANGGAVVAKCATRVALRRADVAGFGASVARFAAGVASGGRAHKKRSDVCVLFTRQKRERKTTGGNKKKVKSVKNRDE